MSWSNPPSELNPFTSPPPEKKPQSGQTVAVNRQDYDRVQAHLLFIMHVIEEDLVTGLRAKEADQIRDNMRLVVASYLKCVLIDNAVPVNFVRLQHIDSDRFREQPLTSVFLSIEDKSKLSAETRLVKTIMSMSLAAV